MEGVGYTALTACRYLL